MKKKILPSIDFLEKKIISRENRFDIIKKEKVEIKNLFKKKNILITGACGSIGVAFTKKILNFNYKNLYLLDKNERAQVIDKVTGRRTFLVVTKDANKKYRELTNQEFENKSNRENMRVRGNPSA